MLMKFCRSTIPITECLIRQSLTMCRTATTYCNFYPFNISHIRLFAITAPSTKHRWGRQDLTNKNPMLRKIKQKNLEQFGAKYTSHKLEMDILLSY